MTINALFSGRAQLQGDNENNAQCWNGAGTHTLPCMVGYRNLDEATLQRKTTSTKPMYSRKLVHPRVYDNTPWPHRKA